MNWNCKSPTLREVLAGHIVLGTSPFFTVRGKSGEADTLKFRLQLDGGWLGAEVLQ